MALYSQPLLWIALAVVAIFRFEFIWLTLVGTFERERGEGILANEWG
jgi:ABC-type antimicrobial peptide transport system permease subunit